MEKYCGPPSVAERPDQMLQTGLSVQLLPLPRSLVDVWHRHKFRSPLQHRVLPMSGDCRVPYALQHARRPSTSSSRITRVALHGHRRENGYGVPRDRVLVCRIYDDSRDYKGNALPDCCISACARRFGAAIFRKLDGVCLREVYSD
jgi:hypothetical protein